jgi:uncharacterized membrane protein YkvA (DUF1232 family)
MRIKQVQRELKNHVTLYIALYKDRRTPKISKALLWCALGYFFLPFDLIPDFIPLIGQLDDLIIVPGLIYISLRFIPKSLYREHHKRIFKIKKI